MRLNLTPKVLKPDLSEEGNGLRCKMITKALAIRLGPSLKLSSSFSATLVFGLLRLRDISKQIFYSLLTIHSPRLDHAMSSNCLASETKHKGASYPSLRQPPEWARSPRVPLVGFRCPNFKTAEAGLNVDQLDLALLTPTQEVPGG